LDYGEIDAWIKVEDEESFDMSRRLIRSEGLLVGGTSGAAVVTAVKLAKKLRLGPDKTMLVILPDSIRDYIAKVNTTLCLYSQQFIDDDWMRENIRTGRQPQDVSR
jgi:cystathionine beta-synthase